MTNVRNRLGQPLFLLSVLALLANGWVGKPAYHNAAEAKYLPGAIMRSGEGA